MKVLRHVLLPTSINRIIRRSIFAVPSAFQEPKMTELWVDITTRLRLNDERRRTAVERLWELNASLVHIGMTHEQSMKSPNTQNNLAAEEESLDNLVKDTVLTSSFYNNIVRDAIGTNNDANAKAHPRAPRLEGMSDKLEDYARYKSFRHFLETGTLISPNAFSVSDGGVERSILRDEEYLGGACIGLCHELANYGITRATNSGADVSAIEDVQKARDIVSQILEELLQFDFRNGPLRRKYDGTKYQLKALETILYELSVARVMGGGDSKTANDTEKEEASMQDVGIPHNEIAAIRARMDHRDQLRESLIKTCRDGQKAAKQAIFALHRGDTDRALNLLEECENCVRNDLMPILAEEPDLRGGSFSGVLEEYVEAYLFHAWLQSDEENSPSGRIVDFASLPLNVSPEEYLGGLCDLSGEVGRYAVACGTKRDKKSVQLCLETNKKIYNLLSMVGKVPKSISKKKSALKISVERLERIMYELSLMEMAGRKYYASTLESDVKSQCNDD